MRARERTREEAQELLQKYFILEAVQMWAQCYGRGREYWDYNEHRAGCPVWGDEEMIERCTCDRVPRGVKTQMGDMKRDGLSTAEICYAIWRTYVQEPELEGTQAWDYVRRIAYNILGRRIDWKGAAL